VDIFDLVQRGVRHELFAVDKGKISFTIQYAAPSIN
jgi:hypothetical protein